MKIFVWALCALLIGFCQAKRINTSADSTDRIVVLRLGKPVELWCNTSTPIQDAKGVKWYKSEEGMAEVLVTADSRLQMESIENGGKLTIDKAQMEDVGIYSCRFEEVGDRTNVQANITLATNASAYISGKSISVKEDGELTITCKIHGKPTPQVSWTKNRQSVEEALNNTDRLSFSDGDGGMKGAILTLTGARREGDAGDYCCHAKNLVGESQKCIVVRVKDKYAALWPFIGIVCEVILLTAIIYIYEKRKGKAPDMDDSDADQPTERSTKGDLRQRK